MAPQMIPADLVEPLFKPASFANRSNIERLLARLRNEYPLNQVEVPGYEPHWLVTKMADLREITAQDEIFHSGDRSKTLINKSGEQLVKEFTGGKSNIFQTLIHLDPPEHRKYRNVAADYFKLDNINTLKPAVEKIAKEYGDKLAAAAPSCDFSTLVAFYYPLRVVLELVGVPEADHAKMLQLTQWLFTYADPDLCRPGSDPNDPQEITKTWKIVFDEFDRYYSQVVADRRRCPRADLASLLANGEVDGAPLEHSKLISYFAIASTAGHDTTAATTGTGMWVLAERPGLLAELRADPSLIPAFVEETIRWATPAQVFIRSATQDYQIRDRTIRKGDLLYISYLSANRDEEAFVDADAFDIHRARNRHVSFGFGGHTCLGIHLARMEVIALWNEIIPRLKSVELAGAPRFTESEQVAGPKSVPIRFEMDA